MRARACRSAEHEDFALAVQRARDLGFDGKWAIHPRQGGAQRGVHADR